MRINPFLCKPERIKDVNELEEILNRMDTYRNNYIQDNDSVGVLLVQNRQLGAIYMIVSEGDAMKMINNPGACEWGVKFYPRSYFEELKEKLGKGKKEQLTTKNQYQ